ncbi:MAG: c-type cytochrome [Myxococcales bacterium]|nr:c-type cytochrome [Myxococcales bacterium]
MKRQSLWIVAVLALTSLALTGCGVFDPNPGPQPAAPGAAPGGAAVPISPGGAGQADPGGGAAGPSAAEGEALFARYCAVCHGADGQGAGPYPASIRDRVGIFAVVTGGIGEMPPFPQLTQADVLDIERFLSDAPAAGGGAGPAPGGALSARDLFAFQCAGCHGEQGEGAALGPQIRSPVAGYATWVIRNGREGVGFGSPMPGYDAQVLPDAQLSELLTWLGGFPKPRDGAGLYGRFCANCHGVGGRGGPVGASLRGEGYGDFLETVREGEGGRRYGSRRDYMPAWTRAQLTDAEVQAIYGYVNGGAASGAVPGAEEDGGDDD